MARPSSTSLPSLPSRPTTAPEAPRHLGLALVVICAAQLMVVLDATIVNVALPSIQRALHFSAANLIWVVNGYTLAFGGLLLFGGRTGDLFGRRRMFIVGVAVFTAGSLLGGLASDEGFLVAARVLQGVGGAVAAPTALALIAVTFPEGRARNRAMGVYAAVSGAGAAIGLLLGGVLTTSLGWRWVLFVNVPVGVAVMVCAPLLLTESGRHRGRLDLPGAVTSTTGMTLLVYGLVHAAATSWSDRWTIGALVAGVVAVTGFVVVEARSPVALLPMRIFADRNRTATYAITLAVGTAIFSMFFFATLFMQEVLGYGALKSGLCYLPAALTIVVMAAVVSRLVNRIGTKPPLVAGTALSALGLLWLTQVTPSSTYVGGLLGPLMATAAGMGVCFVPLTLNAVAGVRAEDQGLASALLNSGQQIGGTLGLAVLGTVAVETTRHQIGQLARSLGGAGAQALTRAVGSGPQSANVALTPAVHRAIATAYVSGYTRALAVGAGVFAGALLLSIVALTGRGRAPQDMAGEADRRAVGAPVAP